MLGRLPTVTPELGPAFGELMGWADRVRRLRVRTNADTPHDAAIARSFGAEGIGLCRTEHMFFEPARILAVRELILASDAADRARALDKLRPVQHADFVGIFRAMDGLPVTIRLLDPPLHEFLPTARGRGRASSPRRSARAPPRCARRSTRCASSTRCSATAAAGSGSRSRRSTACRRARSRAPRARWPKRAARSGPRS